MESDAEFIDSMEQWVIGSLVFKKEHRERLFALARRGAAMQWRPISEAPKDGTRMLLAYRNTLQNWRRVIAFYAQKLTIEQNDSGEGWCEYDEANDRYCLPEGWYECIDNWDDYSYVHMSEVEPTHWMPLSPPPAGEPSDGLRPDRRTNVAERLFGDV